MYGDEQAFLRWLESLGDKFGRQAAEDFRADLIGRLAKMARRHEQDVRDMEAARLLPHGADAVMGRQGGCRATAYNRAKRGREILSNQNPAGRQEVA